MAIRDNKGKFVKTEEVEEVKEEKVTAEKLVSVYVPIEQGAKAGQVVPVIINGEKIEVKMGQVVELPASYAEVLMRSLSSVPVNQVRE